MGLSGSTFQSMREAELAKMPLLELLSMQEYEDYMRQKYGNNTTYKMMLENGEKPTIDDLDNLFNI